MIQQFTPGRVGRWTPFLIMLTYDYNGKGRWAREAVLARYEEYARRYQVVSPTDLAPLVHDTAGGRRIYPVMFKVIEGIKAGDAACVELGVELIESDQRMPFGMVMKSNAAKALRHAQLTDGQQERVRVRVIGMLLAGNVPREFKEYAKLLRRIGAGTRWVGVGKHVDRTNPRLMRYYDYFVRHCGFTERAGD